MSQLGNPVTTTQQFNYDAVGNRSNLTVNSAVTNYAYPAGSNQLQALTGAATRSYVYDAAGNPTTVGNLVETYNNANRRVTVTYGTTTQATYKVNALGQRVEKVAVPPGAMGIVGGAQIVNGVTTRFLYDEQGHLIGEYDVNGTQIQEYAWLEDMPIAVLRRDAFPPPHLIHVYYVLADHLGSPRAVVRPADNVLMWRWDNTDPFGASYVNNNPGGAGAFDVNLRFPGQYYDYETTTHYNYFRDYDPSVGRYEQSDPIGLKGGINTYGYVNGNPLTKSDANGNGVVDCAKALSELAAATARLELRLAHIAYWGGAPDAGHIKALEQAAIQVKNALDKVIKFCSCYAEAAAIISAAVAALQAAAPYLLLLLPS